MKHSRLAILTVALGLICLATTAHAQVKMGFVNTEAIIPQLSEMKDIERSLLALQQTYVDTIQKAEKLYRDRVADYQQKQASLNPTARAQEEDALRTFQQQILQYKEDRLGRNGVLAQEQARLIEPVRIKVSDAIKRVAKDEKMTVVFEQSQVAYYDDKMDITFKVLDYLKRGN